LSEQITGSQFEFARGSVFGKKPYYLELLTMNDAINHATRGLAIPYGEFFSLPFGGKYRTYGRFISTEKRREEALKSLRKAQKDLNTIM
jgi:hypothetical protein